MVGMTEKQTIGDFPVYLLVIGRTTQKTLGGQVSDLAFAVLQRDKKEKHEKNVFFSLALLLTHEKLSHYSLDKQRRLFHYLR